MLNTCDIALISAFGRTPDMADSLEVWRTGITKLIKGHCGNNSHRLDIVNRMCDQHIKDINANCVAATKKVRRDLAYLIQNNDPGRNEVRTDIDDPTAVTSVSSVASAPPMRARVSGVTDFLEPDTTVHITEPVAPPAMPLSAIMPPAPVQVPVPKAVYPV